MKLEWLNNMNSLKKYFDKVLFEILLTIGLCFLVVIALVFWLYYLENCENLDIEQIQPKTEHAFRKPNPLPSRSAEPEYREMFMEATAYSYTGSRTYTGTWPLRGTIAVDPDVIPLGSKLWVEGYGYGIAEDTGGVIKGLKIDLFMETEDECWEWGRRMVKVKIFEQERMDKDED